MHRRARIKQALILGSGEDVPQRPPFFGQGTMVICADGGAALAQRWNLKPEAIIGDQDSLPARVKEDMHRRQVPFYVFPAAKDRTDLDLAVEFALRHGAEAITLIGAWGDRIDHSLGSLELLFRLAEQGIRNELLAKRQRLSAFQNEFTAAVAPHSLVSLLPLSPVVKGVQSEGLLYPLNNVSLKRGSTLTISNRAAEKNISVRSKEGVLLVILES